MTPLFYTLSVALMMALPVGLAVALRRRFAVPWWLFCVGILTFIGSQVYHLPLVNWLTKVGLVGQIAPGAPGLVRTALILGLAAGLCESLARAAGYGLLFWRKQAGRWEDGVMVGLGHGGIEAMIVGGVFTAASVAALWALRGKDLSTLGIPADQLPAVQQQLANLLSSPWLAFAPLLERAIAMGAHVILSVLVWSAFKRRNVLYFLAAILYHTIFDSTAVYVGQYVKNAWALEGILALIALPGILWVWRLGRAEPRPPHPVWAISSELALFATATRKELYQQWRTWRVLVVGAVFLLFGFGSPLTASLMPQLMRSIPGAEQFANLIPTPTVADAMTQYIKNLTQFGFIIAVLVGMGAVVGEKEKGTAALIMTKPMPRWAFILSKFTAQALVYALAFLLSALSAYYYTAILFKPLDFGPFMFGNVLLLVWLLAFAAITLLGSTLAPSTGAAAGIGLGGAVVLLLADYVPYAGALAPGKLVAWAGQLGLAANVSPNAGALAATVVLIVVSLITAIAFFEVQEL
jgi:ABC-2 type transport system permease protein